MAADRDADPVDVGVRVLLVAGMTPGERAEAADSHGRRVRSRADSHGYARLPGLAAGAVDVTVGGATVTVQHPGEDCELGRLAAGERDPLTDRDRSYLAWWRTPAQRKVEMLADLHPTATRWAGEVRL